MGLLDDFMIRASAAGVGVALASGPLGCFVVWKRIAYFSDAVAHAAILGLALALALDFPALGGVVVVALLMGVMLNVLMQRQGYGADTVLGVLSHAALALGLLAVAMLSGIRVDLEAYLFGDILAVRPGDLVLIWGGSLVVLGLLVWRWRVLLTATLNPDLAYAAGLNPRREQAVLTLALAVIVAAAIKVVGALLIGALLVIPAAAAYPLTRTPERMAVVSVLLGMGSVLGGLWLALILDTPTGPTIVGLATVIFAVVSVGAVRSGR